MALVDQKIRTAATSRRSAHAPATGSSDSARADSFVAAKLKASATETDAGESALRTPRDSGTSCAQHTTIAATIEMSRSRNLRGNRGLWVAANAIAPAASGMSDQRLVPASANSVHATSSSGQMTRRPAFD